MYYRPEYEAGNLLNDGPWRITFDTNPDDCNLHCIMCEQNSINDPAPNNRKGKLKRRMDISLIRKVLIDMKDSALREIIPSTMGEPLLYKHMNEIIEMCNEYGIKLNLTTNGTFPILGARAWAQQITPVASDVKISWNGACKETQEFIMEGADWEQQLHNAATFIQVRDEIASKGINRCSVTFQMTFMEANVLELPEIVKLAAQLGVDRVKGHHLWIHSKEMEPQSLRRNSRSIAKWNLIVDEVYKAADKYRLTDGSKVFVDNIFPLSNDSTVDIAPNSVCPFLGKEAWVSAEGRFDPCCAPDQLRRQLGDFGDLHSRSLLDIWHSDEYKRMRNTYRQNSLCQRCNMRRPN
jgi:MoaA/NifB/PqqE/SkfB family radical SAM enzyme